MELFPLPKTINVFLLDCKGCVTEMTCLYCCLMIRLNHGGGDSIVPYATLSSVCKANQLNS